MSARPEPRFQLPHGPRWPWYAVAISLGIHALLLLVRVQGWLPPVAQPLPDQVVMIPLGTEGPRAVEMRFREPSAGGGAPRKPPTSGVREQPRPETGPVPEPKPVDTTSAVVAEPSPPRDTVSAAPAPRGDRATRLGPARGEGKLWVRPLPLPPQELARAVTRSHAELVDSAVTAIVQVYIDSVLNAAPENAPPPSWTTRVGEQQIGIDSRWIYLGPIKIPTALVAAFLPLNGGSAETSDLTRFHQLQQMREDVQIAARRAQTMEDFKRAIRELRAQREREREFAKNQKTPPAKQDSLPKPPPKPIP